MLKVQKVKEGKSLIQQNSMAREQNTQNTQKYKTMHDRNRIIVVVSMLFQCVIQIFFK